jgi:HAE1 family hydrophobic/amphiphilic exporter-1
MAMGLTGGGGFISQPLAVVVIGGLVSSTALTLVLVPVLYRLVEGRREKKALLRELQERPEFAQAADVDEEFDDWTTGMVPKVSGRRAAQGSPE